MIMLFTVFRNALSCANQSSRSCISQTTTSASPIMFTRMDAERNAKSLKRALNTGSISNEEYKVREANNCNVWCRSILHISKRTKRNTLWKESIQNMDDYMSIPGKLLACLANKYSHHCQMKNVEGRFELVPWISSRSFISSKKNFTGHLIYYCQSILQFAFIKRFELITDIIYQSIS